MKNTISVVIPNYNDPRIERTLKSITSQSIQDFEIIVVEGCTDNAKTKPIYKQFNSKINHLIHEPDKGIFDALNKGILKASGELIFLIGSDDVLSDSECFSSVLNTFEKNTAVDGVCLGCRFVTSDNKIVRKWEISKISSTKIKWGLMPPHFSLFLKKQLYDKIGLFDFSETYIASDTEWLLRMAAQKEVQIPVINDHFVDMEYGGTSTGSIKYIFKAFRVTLSSARKHKIKQWLFTPIIKALSKIFQFRILPLNKTN
jgi:glycosyltransferase